MVIRQYNRILKINNGRLTKKVYNWDRLLNNANVVSSWSNEIKAIFYSCNLNTTFDNNTSFPLKLTVENIKSKFIFDQKEYLKYECEQQSKLRTFNKYKNFGSLPAYVTKALSFFERKHMARLRLGCLQLRIESGRYVRPPLTINERICLICSESKAQQGSEPEIETETHFLLFCEKYDILRNKLFSIIYKPENFGIMDEATKLNVILNLPENCKHTAQFIADAYSMRNKIINKL